MNIKGKKVLVIGGAGFIGSAVVRKLLETDVESVCIYDNFTRGNTDNIADSLRDPRCKIFSHGGDIRDLDILDAAMKGVDYVFHLAAMWLLHCKDYPRTAFEVNIAGTFNVLEACVKHGVKKLIYSSSASVYGDAVEVPMTETHPFHNRNFYGATKISGEAMCTAFNDRYGLKVIGLRYMNVYGPGQDQDAAYSGVIPVMLNKIDANEVPTVNGDGSQAYDFIYVDDVAACNLKALASDTEFGFYNVATGVQTSIKTLCELILKLKQSDLNVQYKPYSPDDIRQLVQNRIGSPEKATDDLGFTYGISLEQGLKKLIAWRDNAGTVPSHTVVS
ncbi:MAG: NAD-dependent epimerase/dehydratase family protein [Flavobacteriales bacterium]|nr:NAD-dependent epimerase/dehydratase family protein [Flavobacteriales bacterium]MCB9447530.1 NAD-dependent epimerase/dehydratase family protein [Flavobacteriales bacterium]